MPQFDFANVFLPQLVWLAIFFAVLYFAVVLPTLPKLGRTMQAREDQVTGDLDAAEAAKASADKLAADYDAGVAEAQESARAALNAAHAKATKSLETKLAKADAKLAERVAAAEAELTEARTKALGEVEAIAADVASDLVEQLTGKRPTAADAAKAARAVAG
ncbi:F-type H+-transporting ATPase subunit b [Sphingomonas kyeonggiensis]|uniref:F0F1 ATP synthase subunit B family protein n=1 Tax=Sphingomonas kyeonggiensis TaxID=1268553 RepID=UPI0027800C01|nr:ATPase [Sphingomonas kyeonggiensis]MDQ0251634.1 F-type H+-transporting ATPase subunit b [Sphingomonas kyeonggiensis]